MSTVNLVKDYYRNCESLGDLPKDLVGCRCCDRHRVNFPTLGLELPPFNGRPFKAADCKCPCRHIAREICRKWDKHYEVENIDETESISSDTGSLGSLEDFIEQDAGMNNKVRKKLDRALDMFRGKKSTRR
jgi:hypothetical protein